MPSRMPHSAASNQPIARRTIITAGAWSVPVVALAVAAPAVAATGGEPEPNDATYWFSGATLNINSGGVVLFNVFTQDSEGLPGLLPVGATFAFTPRAGVTLDFLSSTPGTVSASDGNGGYLLRVTSATLTTVSARVRVSGPAGPALDIHSEVSIDPFTEDLTVPIRA